MARKRMIHPEFFSSATLAALDFRTMLTFAGLWIYCDDFGRGEDDPSFIAAAVYPRRDSVGGADVEEDLKALAEAGTICRYVVGDVPLLHVTSWHEHQRVSHPTPTKYPPCPNCELSLFRHWLGDGDVTTDRYRRAERRLRAAERALRNDSGAARE